MRFSNGYVYQIYLLQVEVVDNHSAEVIVVDVVSQEEIAACKAVKQRGVQLIATAYGRTVEDIVNDGHLVELLGGTEDSRQRSKSTADDPKVNESEVPFKKKRSGLPVFDIVVEMRSQDLWVVHKTIHTVDHVLEGTPPEVKVQKLYCPPKGRDPKFHGTPF